MRSIPRKITLWLVFFIVYRAATGQNVYIPDTAFRSALLHNLEINTNGDEEIQVTEAEAYSGQINVHSLRIRDLTGIEAFVNLTDLRVHDNRLAQLDLRANVHLQELHCQDNALTSLDLRANTAITLLRCQDNQLTSLDVSALDQLWYLECSRNKLAWISLSNGSILRRLYAEENNLHSLDLSSFRLLENLRVQDNALVTLNLENGHNDRLEVFDATENRFLACLQVDDPANFSQKWSGAIGEFTSFGDSCEAVVYVPDSVFLAALLANPKINSNQNAFIEFEEAESFSGNINVNGLGISDFTGLESFVRLKGLYFNDNQVATVDVSSLPQLQVLECNDNPISELDVQWNYHLEKLRAAHCALSAIDVTNNAALEYLDVTDNKLVTLDVSKNTSLEILYCSENALTTLDLSGLPALEVAYAFSNHLTSLDLSGDTALAVLNLNYNALTQLDLEAHTKLRELHAVANLLTAVTMPAAPELTTIRVNDNKISALDLSHCPMVSVLWAETNRIDHLDLRNGGNSNMTKFNVHKNYLSCVEVDDSVYFATNWPDEDLLYVTQDCNRDEIYIPDPNLRAVLQSSSKGADVNKDGKIWVCEANVYQGPLLGSSKGIADASGLELFPALKEVNLGDNPLLRSVDVSKNKKLTKLAVYEDTLITSLDVSHNPDLRVLGFQHVKITTIDLSHNPELWELDAIQSELTGTLDLRANTKLYKMNCHTNHLDSILFSVHPLLDMVKCSNNQLRTLDLTGATNLRFFDAIKNQLESVKLPKKLKSIDLIYNELTNLELTDMELQLDVSVSYNNLTSLKVKNTPLLRILGAIKNDLTCIEVDDPEYAATHWWITVDEGVVLSENCDGEEARMAESAEETLAMNIKLFPNPVENELEVVGLQQLTSVKVYSMAGLEQPVTVSNFRIDLSPLCAGVYVVQVSDGERTFTSRVVKQ